MTYKNAQYGDSMSTITGKIESKARSGKAIKVQGQWYNGALNTLSGVDWKDEITMEVDGKDVVSISKTSAAQASKPAAKGSYGGGGYNDDKRQGVILYQSSRKDAIEVVVAALEGGLLPLPTKKEDKFDAFLALVDTFTDRYYTEAKEVFETGELPKRGE